MKRYTKIWMMVFLSVLLVPSVACSQVFEFDVLSVEALIADHKRVRSVLAARAAIEEANKALHNISCDNVVNYDSLNVKLDKYMFCFDVIDVIYNAGVTVVNVHNTYNRVTDRISQLRSLLEKFADECTLHGTIVSSDSLIIGTCQRTIVKVGEDSYELLLSLLELGQYLSGVRRITTAGLMTVMDAINASLDDIKEQLDQAYHKLWKYITIRIHYYKPALYMSRSLQEMANEAFGRWRAVTRAVGF